MNIFICKVHVCVNVWTGAKGSNRITLKSCTILYSAEISWPTLFISLLSHDNYTTKCSVTIKKTGKQVDSGVFTVISAICVGFYDWECFQGWVFLHCEENLWKVNSFTVIPSKTAKSWYFCHSWLFINHSLVQLLLPTVKLNWLSQPVSIEYKMVHNILKTYQAWSQRLHYMHEKKWIISVTTGWTNVNLLYLSDSIEIASLEGLTLWCPEINQSKRLLAWWRTIFMAWRQWPATTLQTWLISDLQLQR